MKTATKAQVREAAANTDVTVQVAPTKPARKPRTPKTVEQALSTEIGAAPEVDRNAFTPAQLAAVGLKPVTPKPAKAPTSNVVAFVGPMPAPSANVAGTTLYAMPAGVAVRPGTRKAAVYAAMCAVAPATRADLIAAAEMAEQEWRCGTKRLEAPKPGAKWFRRFAPAVVA